MELNGIFRQRRSPRHADEPVAELEGEEEDREGNPGVTIDGSWRKKNNNSELDSGILERAWFFYPLWTTMDILVYAQREDALPGQLPAWPN